MGNQVLFSASALAGRLLMAALFLWDGWQVAGNYAGTTDYLAQHGLPGIAVPAALALQLGGGALVTIGWWTRLAALGLAVFCLSTAGLFHTGWSDFGEQIHFWKDIALAGGFLGLVANGAGAWSVDGYVRK